MLVHKELTLAIKSTLIMVNQTGPKTFQSSKNLSTVLSEQSSFSLKSLIMIQIFEHSLTVTYPEFFWGERFQRVGVEAVMPPYVSRAKPWWGPGGKAPEISKDLVLWNHLLLIKLYPPLPMIKLIQCIFFKNLA